jgi:hypothetical protein
MEAHMTDLGPWFKSTYSGNSNQCVETRQSPSIVQVRDTKDKGNGPSLTFSAEAWTDFLDLVNTLS